MRGLLLKPSKMGNEQSAVTVSKASIPVNPDGIKTEMNSLLGQSSNIGYLDKVKLRDAMVMKSIFNLGKWKSVSILEQCFPFDCLKR